MEAAIPLGPPVPIPRTLVIPTPTLEQPQIREFEWEPIPIYPGDVSIPEPTARPVEEQKEEETTEEPKSESLQQPDASDIEEVVPEIAEILTVEIPLTGIEVPVPRPEILATAATTAGISSVVAVSGTLLATTLFRQLQPILKPIFKAIAKKVASKLGKKPPLSYGRVKLLARHQRKLGKKAIQEPK